MSPSVLLANDVGSLGGGKTAMLEVTRLLISSGFETHVASPLGDLATEAKMLGAEWHEFSFRQRRLLTPRHRLPRPAAIAARVSEGRRLAALAAEVSADIVHTGALIPHLDAVVGGCRSRARLLWHVNQVHPSYLFAGALPDRIVSVSRAALQPGAWRKAVVQRSIVVPNAVDGDHFRPALPAERALMRNVLGLNGRFTIMTVARLEPLKGVDTLIRAVARSHCNPILLVVGDSTGFSGGNSYTESLRELGNHLKVDVRFLGARTDVADLLRAVDLFAFASRWEAFGLVLAEASASGLAVVSSNTGGCPEVVVNGVTGVLVPPDDIGEFAAQFDLLANDTKARADLAWAGRQRAATAFDGRELGKRLLPLYAELADSSSPRRSGPARSIAGFRLSRARRP